MVRHRRDDHGTALTFTNTNHVQQNGVFQLPEHAHHLNVQNWRPNDRLDDLLGAVLYRPRMAHIHRRRQVTLRIRAVALALLLAATVLGWLFS